MMNTNDIAIAYIAFQEISGGKRRPVLIVTDGLHMCEVMKLTSKKNESKYQQKYYFEIVEWKLAGLTKPSYIDTGKIIQIDKRTVHISNVLGRLTKKDASSLAEFMDNL